MCQYPLITTLTYIYIYTYRDGVNTVPIALRGKPTSNVSNDLKTFENDFLNAEQQYWIHSCHFANIKTVMSNPMGLWAYQTAARTPIAVMRVSFPLP